MENGDVKIQFVPGKGSIRLVLKNPAWDYDQNGMERTLTFTYNVAVSDNKPVIKPDQNTVSLNLNYPEKMALEQSALRAERQSRREIINLNVFPMGIRS